MCFLLRKYMQFSGGGFPPTLNEPSATLPHAASDLVVPIFIIQNNFCHYIQFSVFYVPHYFALRIDRFK